VRIIFFLPAAIAAVGVALVMVLGERFPISRPVGIPLFVGLAVGTTLAALIIPRFTAQMQSLRREILAVAGAAMVTAGATIAVAAGLLFLQPGQFGLLLVVAVMGAAFGLVVEYAVARGLAEDARQLKTAAARLAQGDLDARSGVDRADEIGQAPRRSTRWRNALPPSRPSAATNASPARRSFPPSVTICERRWPRCEPPSTRSRMISPPSRTVTSRPCAAISRPSAA